MAYNSSFGAGNISFKRFCFRLFLRTMVAAFLTLIIYLSVTTLINGFNYKALGYDILYTKDGQNFEKVHTYIYTGEEGENWVDEELLKYVKEDGSLMDGYYQQTIPNQLSADTLSKIKWVSQIAGIVIWCGFIYTAAWGVGNAVADKEQFGGQAVDKLFALKAALIALIPFAASYVILWISKIFGVLNWSVSLFKILNYNFLALNDTVITGPATKVGILGLIALVLVLVPMPLMAHFGYRMGNKQIILKEKIIYKNN